MARLSRRLACAAAVAIVLGAAAAPAASAVVGSPVTLDGPSPTIIEMGGVAIAPDGSGGLVYTKEVEGTAHVFVCRYSGGQWSLPVRVDSGNRFAASEPRIAAGDDGQLLVVWVAPDATVSSQIQRGLFSASSGRGSAGFGPSILVDPDVGVASPVEPDLAGATASKAIVSYRVVTFDFSGGSGTAVQLRPGDVLADIRVARLNNGRWSRLGVMNRNPAASMRPLSPANAPVVGIGATGNAVVAWQEPDAGGAARIWARRIFSGAVGPPVQVSPSTWEGAPVTGDADGLALGVTSFDQARIVSRVNGAAGTPSRLFIGTFEPNYKAGGANITGPVLAASGTTPLGVAAIGVSGIGGGEGKLRLAFAEGGAIRRFGLDEKGGLSPLSSLGAPAAAPGAEVFSSVDPEGGGVTAYTALGVLGTPAVSVLQEFPQGMSQTAVLEGTDAGPISQLRGDGAESGDALVGFRQGEPGNFEIVADRISAPPEEFTLQVAKKWVRPAKAILRWDAAPSGAPPVRYAVVLDGQIIRSGLVRQRYRPRPAVLGSGLLRARVLATDAFGGQVLTATAKLRVDGRPPSASASVKGAEVTVHLRDAESGVRIGICSFGDGSKPVRGNAVCRHHYAASGAYTVVVRERDRAGNQATRRLRVTVR